eukprot:CCRYP_009208-RA/>CCRYP_009208-RA protein AED:0.11 eAED:0.11 QI:0/0/0/1/0/0/2/0/348
MAQLLLRHIRSSDLASWKLLADVLDTAWLDENDAVDAGGEGRYNPARRKALHWLSEEKNDADVNVDEDTKHIQLLQRYALATIYFATSAGTGGWNRCSPLVGERNADTETPCESDENRHLSPSNHLEWEGINGKKRLVTWLDFNGRNLSNCDLSNNGDNHDGADYAVLPLELTLLSPSLELMWLHSNPLCGSLPSYIGEFTNLQSLSLYSTNMGGTLPPSLYELDKLASLRLYKSNFGGQISGDIKRLQNLKWMWIHENQFTGPLPGELRELNGLEGITLHGNRFHDGDNSSALCHLLKNNLKYLWTDCEKGSVWKKGEEWMVMEGERACECCTRCFPKETGAAVATD